MVRGPNPWPLSPHACIFDNYSHTESESPYPGGFVCLLTTEEELFRVLSV
jgi:hypothetical protein